MNNIDLLIEIRSKMYGAVVGSSIEPVLKIKQWEEIVYKCLCSGATEEQIKALIDAGIDKNKVYEILNVGKDCGSCVKNEGE